VLKVNAELFDHNAHAEVTLIVDYFRKVVCNRVFGYRMNGSSSPERYKSIPVFIFSGENVKLNLPLLVHKYLFDEELNYKIIQTMKRDHPNCK
jgi:hypothetical protein